jgi:hypothetical protein
MHGSFRHQGSAPAGPESNDHKAYPIMMGRVQIIRGNNPGSTKHPRFEFGFRLCVFGSQSAGLSLSGIRARTRGLGRIKFNAWLTYQDRGV